MALLHFQLAQVPEKNVAEAQEIQAKMEVLIKQFGEQSRALTTLEKTGALPAKPVEPKTKNAEIILKIKTLQGQLAKLNKKLRDTPSHKNASKWANERGKIDFEIANLKNRL